MPIHKFAFAEASLEHAAGQCGDIFAGNVIDQRHGWPGTIGFGRYDPHQTLEETMAVHNIMVILDGEITVADEHSSVTAGPGEIVAMKKGDTASIRSHDEAVVTAYVTCPHWQQPDR